MKKEFTLNPEHNIQRIDLTAAEIFGADSSRSHLQKYGKFELQFGDKWLPKTYKSKGQADQTWRVTYQPPVDNSRHLKPWGTKLDIIAETDHWLAINKPIGVSVHPSASENSDQTVVNALMHYFGKNFAEKFENAAPSNVSAFNKTDSQLRPGIVHRLDKTTSGILLVAKDHQTLRLIQKNWAQTQKFYVAIVQGTPPNKGKISGGIMRDPKNRLRVTVSDHHKAKPSTSLFELIKTTSLFRPQTTEKLAEKKNNSSLLKVQILTGRTHQIRAHLSSVGFPIIGDELYGGKTAERIFLHAKNLIFTDPHTGEIINLTAPIPAKFGVKYTE
jgi:23S rRNA pseudouridine1911/1915/1917 synthase